jgi:hypothetical protein
MARNRMIKPEFWSSETLMRVSRDSRLTFIGIWNFCDDYGFCLRSMRSLIGDIYPYDESVTEAKLKQWVSELVEVKLLIPVDYNGKHLFFVKGWGEHQTVQHKSKRSFVHTDDLEQVIKDSLKSHESLISVYLESHAPKRKKKEKEKEKEKGFTPPTYEEYFQYCKKEGFSNIAERSFKGYAENNWHDAHGNPVMNWKSKLQNGWFKSSNKDTPTTDQPEMYVI